MHEFYDVLKYIPIYQLGLINGKLLGDGSLTIEKNKSPRLRFQHRNQDKDWCFYCYTNLKDFVPLTQPKYKRDKDSRVSMGFSESVYVQSKTSVVFNYLKEKWYKGRVKVVPIDILQLTLTPEALAWWYQDDGYLLIKGGIVKKIILSTDNFSPSENNLLIEMIKDKFKLQFSLDGQNRLCIYDKRQIMYFFHLVKDYLHPSMMRKQIPTCSETGLIFPHKKRTSVYLPIKLQKPTKEIKELIHSITPERFIKKWFEDYQLITPNHLEWQFAHQVTLTNEELLKVSSIQRETGVTMSEILSISIIEARKKGLSSGQTS